MSKTVKKIMIAVVAIVSILSVCLLTACNSPKSWAEAENKTATEVYTFSAKLNIGTFLVEIKESKLNVVRQYNEAGDMNVTIKGDINLSIPQLSTLNSVISQVGTSMGTDLSWISSEMKVNLDVTLGYNAAQSKYKGFGTVKVGTFSYTLGSASAPVEIDAATIEQYVSFSRDAVSVLYSNDVATTGTVKSDVAFKGWYDQFVAGVVNNTTKYKYTGGGEEQMLTMNEMCEAVTEKLLGADRKMNAQQLFDFVITWKGFDIACTADMKGDLIQSLTTEQKDVTLLKIKAEDATALLQSETTDFVLSFFDFTAEELAEMDEVIGLINNTAFPLVRGWFESGTDLTLTTSLKIESAFTYGDAEFTTL